MPKLPFMQFYTGDWLKDPAVSLCMPATRGVWMDLLCAIHELDRGGELRGTTDQLARIARCLPVQLAEALTDLQATGAADISERNGVFTIVSRRIARTAKEREQWRLRQERRREKVDVTPASRGSPPVSSSSEVIKSNPPSPLSDPPAKKTNGGGAANRCQEPADDRLTVVLRWCCVHGFDAVSEKAVNAAIADGRILKEIGAGRNAEAVKIMLAFGGVQRRAGVPPRP